MDTPGPTLSFDLDAFRERVRRVRAGRKIKTTYLSKLLFGNAVTLPAIMDATVPDQVKTFPRLDTLLRADDQLRAMLAALDEAGEG